MDHLLVACLLTSRRFPDECHYSRIICIMLCSMPLQPFAPVNAIQENLLCLLTLCSRYNSLHNLQICSSKVSLTPPERHLTQHQHTSIQYRSGQESNMQPKHNKMYIVVIYVCFRIMYMCVYPAFPGSVRSVRSAAPFTHGFTLNIDSTWFNLFNNMIQPIQLHTH